VVSPREDAEPSTAGAVEPKRKFRGRVEDVGGAPAPHLGIWLHRGHVFEGQPATSAAPLAVSLADGRFELEELDEFGWLEARAPGWITVLSPALVIAARPADAPEPAVIVARSRAIAGDVLDEDGLPVAGAAVGFTLGRGLFREPGRDLAAAEELDWSTESGADGRFAFADAPEVDGVVAASAEGYEPAFERLLAAQSPHVTLVLSRRRAEHATVRGTVVDELGRPIEDALVALGIDSQHTSADGRFAFDVERRADDELLELEPGVWQIRRLTDGLRAVARGRLPVALPLPGFAELVHADPRDLEFTLVLARTSLSIAGRVLEPGGAPAASAYVAIRESTRFGREVRQQGQSSFAFDVSAEGVMSGQGGQTGCLTDDAGRFELDGLLERDYEITVFDPATLRMIMAGPFAAGTDTVEITLSGREELGRIAGRLVSARGLPVAGANLIAGRDLGAGVGPMLMRGFTTDDDGRFECAGVVLDDLVIQVEDARLIPTVDYRLADGDDPQALEIRVALRCPLQVDLEGAGVRADAFSVVGSGGEPLQVVMSFGGMFAMVDEIEFHGVRSEVVGVPESAVELVLRLGGAETARVPIAPRPGEVTIVRL
jgi:protocatechuate 3,4-dioxygenase beta subunit